MASLWRRQSKNILGTIQPDVLNHSYVAYPHFFDLDDHHRFITGKPMLVCGNTASMLAETRYAPHFTSTGDRSVHFGPFDCAPAATKATGESVCGGACC